MLYDDPELKKQHAHDWPAKLADLPRGRSSEVIMSVLRNRTRPAGTLQARLLAMARLARRKAEERRQRLFVIGNLRLDQQAGAAGNAQQLADRAPAAAGDRQRGLASGPVQGADQVFPRGRRRDHGA